MNRNQERQLDDLARRFCNGTAPPSKTEFHDALDEPTPEPAQLRPVPLLLISLLGLAVVALLVVF